MLCLTVKTDYIVAGENQNFLSEICKVNYMWRQKGCFMISFDSLFLGLYLVRGLQMKYHPDKCYSNDTPFAKLQPFLTSNRPSDDTIKFILKHLSSGYDVFFKNRTLEDVFQVSRFVPAFISACKRLYDVFYRRTVGMTFIQVPGIIDKCVECFVTLNKTLGDMSGVGFRQQLENFTVSKICTLEHHLRSQKSKVITELGIDAGIRYSTAVETTRKLFRGLYELFSDDLDQLREMLAIVKESVFPKVEPQTFVQRSVELPVPQTFGEKFVKNMKRKIVPRRSARLQGPRRSKRLKIKH